MSIIGYANGYSVSKDAAEIGVRTYKVPGTEAVGTILLPVRASVAPLLIGAAMDYHRLVEQLHKGWCWGWAVRAVTGGTSWSWHSPGIAIDLNAPAHPYNVRGTYTPMQLQMLFAICRKYGLRSGEQYKTNVDGMHLEVILSPAEAAKRVKEIQSGDAPIFPFPGYLEKGSQGFNVRVVQRGLNGLTERPFHLKVDGSFGPATQHAVSEYRKRMKWGDAPRVGPKVWRALL